MESLKGEVLAFYQPYGPIESWLAERIVICQWRMRRAIQEETRETLKYNNELVYNDPGLLPPYGILEKIIKYETTASRELFRAMTEIERLQTIRLGQGVKNAASSGGMGAAKELSRTQSNLSDREKMQSQEISKLLQNKEQEVKDSLLGDQKTSLGQQYTKDRGDKNSSLNSTPKTPSNLETLFQNDKGNKGR